MKKSEFNPRRGHRVPIAVAGISCAVLAASPARAAPEEIQVYLDDMSRPGQIGLDIHTNYVLTGDKTPDYPDEQRSVDRLRVTPEFALGLTKSLELGAYLPLATLDHTGTLRADGAKLRLKYIAPRRTGQDWFWGLNFEIGRVAHHLDQNPWNAELKGIAGVRRGRWTFALNTNLDFKVSGPARSPATLELATKVNYALSPRVSLGVENYNGVGELKHPGRFGSSEQSSFLILDTNLGKWDFECGAGTGYGANADRLTIKAIIGIPIG
ncbi:MAG: hypothetical protein KGL48_09330 [Sphingomonadales bacterium]|nr:hypothetical protein [Sphingomonadales bacterium]MDE2568393.1 hypothetical protein [Sphingomonadales bacterium]